MRKLAVVVLLLVTALPASATTSRILAPMDWWPVWSPDGSHVAFTRIYPNRMELYTLDLRTHRTVHMGTNAGQLGPTWSSDGTQLAYSSGGLLYTVNADGTHKARRVAPVRAFAPAWRPKSTELAYLTTKGSTNTDLWVSGAFWAPNAIGTPAWSPDGQELAFQRDDGIYLVNGPTSGRRLAVVANPGLPAWSHDGTQIAYVAHGILYTTLAVGGAPRPVGPVTGSGAPNWSRDDARVTVGVAWSPLADGVSIAPGPRPACPGHAVLRESGASSALTGSCTIAGTSRADVIEGTPLWGDDIRAGAGSDRIHANDGHTDRVDCGPGRDTVWADRSDRLKGCEIVHR